MSGNRAWIQNFKKFAFQPTVPTDLSLQRCQTKAPVMIIARYILPIHWSTWSIPIQRVVSRAGSKINRI